MSDNITHVSDATFENDVLKSDTPVLVDFWAEWCGPCKMMAPQFAAAAKQLPNVRFAKVDTEAAQQTASLFNIRSIPTMVVFAGGSEIARQSGAMSAADIAGWVSAAVAKG